MMNEEIKEVGQTSSTSDQSATGSDANFFKRVMDVEDFQTPNKIIRTVPFMLRGIEDFKKYFEPRLVSIGPYHHGEDNLKPAETMKLQFAKRFISESGKPIKNLYEMIFDNIEDLRAYYDEKQIEKYSEQELSQILFVDGCSVLYYIDRYTDENSTFEDLKVKDYHVAIVDQDLFLVTNQVPFLVLELLMRESSKFEGEKGMEMIEKFIKLNFETQIDKKKKNQQQPQQPSQPDTEEHAQHVHLLDLLRKRLVGKGPTPDSKNVKWQQHFHLLDPLRKRLVGKGPTPDSKKVKWQQHFHLLDPLRKRLVGKGPTPDSGKFEWHSFRNITELIAAGIHLKPSETDYLRDVSFESHCISAVLKLPRIVINDSTKPKFLNLIAYEMSPGVHSQSEVTSYICFLDSLIDHPEDVQQLRKAHIIQNQLGSDEEVAKPFNEISTDLVPNNELYKDVKAEIQKHYNSKAKCWMAQFIHDHFSSPWSVLAFIGALLALLLTFGQTYLAISPLPSNCDGLCDYLKERYI